MNKLVLSILGILTMAFSCDYFVMDRVYPIKFKNKFKDSIEFYFIKPGGGKLYPDTTLAIDKPSLLTVQSGKEMKIYLSVDYNAFFKEIPSDTLSVFVIHTDTLNKYSWNEVRENYFILKRYDLSFEDLESMNWTVTYP